jgi:hypothetical protein
MNVVMSTGEEEPRLGPVQPVGALDARRRNALVFVAAFATGALIALLLFAHLITAGSFDFDRRVPFGDDIYDVQARRLFDGRWDMPLDVVAVEGYRHDGKLYMYFGPVPSFLRMPVLAATDVRAGELTQEWMVISYAAALAALGSLAWRIRRLVRGDARVGLLEAVTIAIAAVAFGAGSTLLFLGSGPWVYHEAILWGIAFSIMAFDAFLAWLERARWWILGLAALLTALAVGSRLTLGLAPLIAVGSAGIVVLVCRLWPWARKAIAPRVGMPPGAISLPAGFALGAAAGLPLALYAWLNNTKFGTWFGIPFEAQLLNRVQANRFEVLERNDGSLFHLYGIPAALEQYFRPDAIGFRSRFPWLRFPAWLPSVPGDVVYDHLDRTSSVPAAMPLLTLLAIVGLVVVVRARKRTDRATPAALRLPLLAAALAPTPTLMFLFLTQRYTGDFIPFLVIAGLVGFFVLVAWASRQQGWGHLLVAVAVVVLVALAAWSVLANYGMARDWQHEHLPPEQRFAGDRAWP